jgi:L,D-transpeptidase YcbB
MYQLTPGKKFLPYFFLLLFTAVITACNMQGDKKRGGAGYADDPFAQKLETIFKPIDTTSGKSTTSIAEKVRYTYQTSDYQPIWVNKNYVPNEASGQLVEELEDIRWDGLDPERYNLSAIKTLKARMDTMKKNSINDAVAFDTALTHSFLAASRDLLLGKIKPKKADSLWFHANDSVWNASTLLVESRDRYPSLNRFRSKVPTYELLRNEYKQYYHLISDSAFLQALAGVKPVKHPDSAMMDNIFYIIKTELPWLEAVPNDSMSKSAQLIGGYQNYIGMRATGKLDSATLAGLATPPDTFLKKISINLERLRWMQQEFGDLYTIVDVPLMELFLRRAGENVMHMRVVVGRPERQTPSIFANMSNIIINPSWGVPPTILKNDVVPGFEKSGRKYMAKKGLKAYDKKGNPISMSALNAGNIGKYSIKQAPGDDNSLGFVKFNLPNPFDIYLHDTPHRSDFSKRYRALSSGCIRVEQPQEMAIYILSQIEKLYFTQGKLDTMITTHKSRWELLKTKIPVHIAYLTAFEDTTGKHIQYVKDIYSRDEKLAALCGN